MVMNKSTKYDQLFQIYSSIVQFIISIGPSVGWKKSLLEISPPLPLIVILVMYVVSFMSAIKSLIIKFMLTLTLL
jgi:hypothetical protein